MAFLGDLRALDRDQRHTLFASYLGWTLDAFDFFLLVFVLKAIAEEFQVEVSAVSYAIFLTLAARPIGALLFGLAADRYGRRPVLMVNILLYSFLEFASGFSPNLTVLIVLRALYGVAMGGEWGIGASLVMESVPERSRGIVSGILQAGYPSGYLLASVVYLALFPMIGWRGLFMVGVLPALLVLYVRRTVKESPAFERRRAAPARVSFAAAVRGNLGLLVWAVLLMTAFNFFSHGTQDVYPTFLEKQLGYSSTATGTIAVVYNLGAILGGLTFGAWSQRVGRRKAIVVAALLAMPAAWLWTQGGNAVLLAAGAFLVQFFVQGAWGVVPAHLNEISPPEVRGTFPGTAYQLGNLLASGNATIQAMLAEHWGGDYGRALLVTILVVAVAVALLAGFGAERRTADFTADAKAAPAE
ncbi:MFS transporter [Aureimonas endophytica]|uniref:MFS transporter n=1 Tax=Aureimonas endophytica TaxID=2027858 RepID=A0A916ZE41_9HYPH|nr:MFS transporter [Aureimonas endophytica]GGD91175.1 MFS transporter [Aureimonas endophytica]